MHSGVERILISEEQISKRTAELAAQITKDYAGKQPVVVGVLRGSLIFMADLIRKTDLDCTIDFICMSSYSGTESTGEVCLRLDLRTPINGKDIIIVEDIVDTGLTMKTLTKLLSSRAPASIKVCTLLDKPSSRKTDFKPDYAGFVIENEFVIGYGLDHNELYRNLPYIGVYKQQ